MVEISKEACELTIVLTFVLLVFCCIGIDYIPKNLTSERLNHPFVRFTVLAAMALAFSCDHYLAILIGFTYLLTKHQLLINNDMKSCGCNNSPVVKKDVKKLVNLKKSVKLQNAPLKDSVFVKGSRIMYDSGVIADTALEPGQTATYNFPVKIKNRRKVQYHTMDIHWNTTE